MPPYTPVVSKAQSRALFAKANRGELSMDEARGKTRAANWASLPARKEAKRGTKRGATRGSRTMRKSASRAARGGRA